MQKISKTNVNKSTSSIVFETYNLLKHYQKDLFFSAYAYVIQTNVIGKY